MRTLFIILILLLCTAPSRAVIPLELVAEYEIYQDQSVFARSYGWDAQHFYNDSTITLVWLGLEDTLFYDLGDGEGIHVLPLLPPDSIPPGSQFRYYKYPVMFKDAASPNLPVIAVEALFGSYFSMAYTIDLSSGETISAAFVCSSADQEIYPNGRAVYKSHEVWPPLPAVTQKLFITRSIITNYYIEQEVEVYSERGEITTYAVPSFTVVSNHDSSSALATFPDTSQLEMVFAGGAFRHDEWQCGPEPDDYCFHRESFRAVYSIFSNPLVVCSVECSTGTPCTPSNCFPAVSIAAVEDSIGNKYAIIDTTCYDAVTGNILWTNPTRLPAFAGLNYPSPDQQKIFSKVVGNTFYVYEPSTGAQIGTTTSWQGMFHHALNLPGKLGEFVTQIQFVGIPWCTIRFFRLNVEPTIIVTIAYLPLAESLRLIWNPLPGATSYEVCRSTTGEGNFCDEYIHFVTDTSLVLPIQFATPKQFFRVRAVFE